MILNKVKIKNYRQYKDVEIDFASGGKNFTIIQGNNGTGKSTLLNALSWCLYGEEPHDYGDNSAMGYCNNKAAFLANDGEKITVSVQMEFNDKGKILTFKRKIYYTKNNNEVIKSLGTIFEAYEQVGNDIKTSNNDAYIIDQKIPREIEEYFFFDGALLGKYFQSTSSSRIKSSILELSQINLLSNVEKNTKSLISKYNKDLKKIAPKLGEASIKLMECENKIEEYQNDIVEAESNNRVLEEELSQIDSELLDKNSKDITQLVKKEQDLESKIDTTSDNLKKYETKRKEIIIKTYPILLSYEYLAKFLDVSEESRKKGTIPPLYEKRFIKDLLENNKCICGTDLNLNENSRIQLEKVLNDTSDVTDMASDITKAVVHVENLVSDVKNFKKDLTSIKEEIMKNQLSLDKMLEEKRNISATLKLNPIEEISKLQTRKEDLQKIRDQNIRKIGSLEQEIKLLNKEKKEYSYQKTKEDKLNSQAILLEEKIYLAKETNNAVKSLIEDFSAEIHEKIEEFTKKQFLRIQWKDGEFVDIRIDKNYGVHIKNKIGQYERPGDLSDGEKLCLGLCFLSGLHNISGYKLPIIMDTPLGVLDKDLKQNLAKFLPDFVDSEQQVVLLVTGTEYSEDFRNIISENVGKEYLIKFFPSNEGKESKVIFNA